MGAPEQIKRLVDTFQNNLEAFKSSSYNETQARREFIDPFFTSLGWDIENKSGYAEAYKDVIHEYSLKTKDVTEAPDYCFRIGGTKKFFVEAKKPSVNLKDDIHPSFQLRRYAWTAKLPLSILTDFEELAVYDCRILPKKTDKASVGRVLFHNYTDYIDKWDEIESIFSREAVLKGSFDKYVESNKKKKGTAEVDNVFLVQMEEWRKILARNIALRNPKLSIRELNFAVQKTIDRIIFLRICEDRGIEDYGQLMNLLNGANVYERLKQVYHRADEKYNSGLFHFELEKDRNEPPDNLTLDLAVDDKTIKDIVKNLYYPDSPYEFSVLPADILGQVYEQFLGKVIRLTPSHQAVIEDKPEVKKAGGVYYTPTYIVDYIVKNTLGRLLFPHSQNPDDNKNLSFRPASSGEKSKDQKGLLSQQAGVEVTMSEKAFATPKEVSSLRILDPACGSGSFLIGAFQYLLTYHEQYYNQQLKSGELNVGSKNSPVYETDRGELRLTTTEKKRILLNNIYGVDIDSQAVEVTKLSLLLKVLEGESDESLASQMKMFRERALPDLSENIKCGNSLIGPDFYEQTEMNFLDDEEKLRINVFDWHKEFPQVFKPLPNPLRSKSKIPLAGERESKGEVGFDIVIGNPPYVRQELIGEFKNYFENSYKVYHGIADLYSYFIERAVTLLKEGGYFSYIVANKWMRANYGEPLRKWMKNQNLLEIVDFGDLPVFKGATTYPCIINISKGKVNDDVKVVEIKSLEFKSLVEVVNETAFNIKISGLNDSGWNLVRTETKELLEKLFKKGVPLEKYVNKKIYRGVLTGLNKAFVIDEETKNRLINEDPKSAEIIKPFLAGRDIKRYATLNYENYLIFSRRGIDIKHYPALEKYLLSYKTELTPKPKDWKGKDWKGRKPGSYKWYELQDTIDYYSEFKKPKIIYPNICKRNEFTFDESHNYTNQKCFIIGSDDKYLLAILNSKIFYFLFQMKLPKLRGGFFEPSYVFLKDFPIANTEDKLIKKKLENHSNEMLRLNAALEKTKTPTERTAIERQIQATDKQIDQLVYKLYELTDEEIKIVEGN